MTIIFFFLKFDLKCVWKYLKNISDDSLVFQHSFSESEVTIYIKCQGHFEICEVSKCWNMTENCNNICMGLDNRKIILMFSLSARIPSLEFPSIKQKHKFFYRPPDTFGPLSRLCRFQISLYLHVMYLSPTSQHLLNSHNIQPSQLMPHPTPFFTEKKNPFITYIWFTYTCSHLFLASRIKIDFVFAWILWVVTLLRMPLPSPTSALSGYAIPKYAFLVYYFELKSLKKQQMQEELFDLLFFYLKTGHKIFQEKGVLHVSGREENPFHHRLGINAETNFYKQTY